jgi:hypothetical protein
MAEFSHIPLNTVLMALCGPGQTRGRTGPLKIQATLDALQAKVNDLRRLQGETQQELDAMIPSILAKAFAGEL